MKIRNSFVANSSSSSFVVVFADKKTMLEVRKNFFDVLRRNSHYSTISNTEVRYKQCLENLQYDIARRAEMKKKGVSIKRDKLFANNFYGDMIMAYKIKKLIENSFYFNLLSDDDFDSHELITYLVSENIIKEMI